MKIVTGLARQLHAALGWTAGDGTRFRLDLPRARG
jgi:hypothetical protein